MSAHALPATGEPVLAPGQGGAGAPGWLPCSDRSRERGDPLAATGGRGLQWFLVEYEGAWGTRALLDPPFDVELGAALVKRIESAGMRPLAIRRTGRHPERLARGERGAELHATQQRWRWAFVDSRPGHEIVRWGEVTDPLDLLDVPLDGRTGTASDRPLFAVCAHARHDQCCAVRGRQVVTRLAESYPEETWECSHLGGDRFAGTMVLFPHGLYYGRADDGDAVRIAESYVAGPRRGGVVPGAQLASRIRCRLPSISHASGSATPASRPTHPSMSRGMTVATATLAGPCSFRMAAAPSRSNSPRRSPNRCSPPVPQRAPARVRQWQLLSLSR